jgi:hypothetical protein
MPNINYPSYVISDQDKYYMDVFCWRELDNWREILKLFHSIDRHKWGGLTKRMKNRPDLEKAWKDLKQAFLNCSLLA